MTGLKGGTTTVRGTYAGLSATAAVTVVATNPLPPDPTTIATAIDPTKPTNFADSIAFLYGPSGTQNSMTPGAINTAHVNVIRGRVLDTTGVPISGVRVSALRSPEVGYTFTRPDGTYDLVVNGGGWVVVAFDKDGLITAHRSVHTSWQDFAVVDDVRMTAYDSRATTIDLTQGAAIAQGSVVTDTDGTRQATLLFPAGATATAVKPDGSTTPLSTLTVRATEQTVGKDGAMPADIAPGTAYTYCVELSADEAVAIGATTIQFSKPVALYVDDFLNFPVGSNVPSGFYDRVNARWVPIVSGRVVKIIAISGGLASLDITGDGVADDASAIGITDVERGQLASLYPVGKTLWRVSLDHFTPIDPNWADGFPADAVYPNEAEGAVDPSVEGQSCQAGSIIECESDTLGKTIPITGTPYTLEYRSREAVAYTGNRTVDIRLTDATIPASLKRVELTLLVAGQRFSYVFGAAPNLVQTFTWDGRDGYGRFNYLDKDLYVHIAYVYDGKYKVGGTFGGDAFALATSVPTRNEVRIGQDYTVRLSGPRPAQGLGGWFISAVHSYDAGSHILRLGSGEDVNMEARGDTGQQEAFAPSDAGAVFTGPDGSVYAYGPFLLRIARVDSSGLFSVIAGGLTANGPTTDGSPAVGAAILVRGFSLLPDGDYVFTTSDPSGAGDNLMLIHNGLLKKLTTTISLHININSVTAAPDGTILIADDIRGISAVDKSGNLTSVYPESFFAAFGANPNVDQAVYKEDGRLYVYLLTSDSFVDKVVVLRNGAFKALPSPCANHLYNFTARPDGSLLFNCGCSNIFTTTPSIKIVAADGSVSDYTTVPAVSTCNASFASLPNGQLVHSESTNTTSGVCVPQKACVILGGVAIPFAAAGGSYIVGTPDGSNSFKFGIDGRLQEARDALTNTLLYSATYTASGLPSTITDAYGLVTTIQRGADGAPSAIVAPNGDTTTLTIGTDGLISAITLPGSVRHAFTYDNGSLRHYTDPRGHETSYDYDPQGRLTTAHDAAGGSKSLIFAKNGNSCTVQLTTGGGQTSVYTVQSSAPGNASRTITSAGGTTTFAITPISAHVTDADGTATAITRSADPLWGATASYVSSAVVTLPSGNTFTMTRSRLATASSSSDPLSLTSFTDTAVVNGSVYKLVYTGSTRTLRLTSPMNRIVDRAFDTKGRLSTIVLPGQTAISLAYDSRGHLTTITQGSRVKTFTWSADDRLSAVADSSGATGGFSYDAALRPVTQVLPGNRSATLGYDENGNVTSFTPPGGQANLFAYSPINRATSWSRPSGAVTGAVTNYQIDIDRRLNLVTRPSGAQIGFTYASGRLATVTSPSGTRQYGYDAGGSLASIAASDGPTITYTHDGMLATGQSWSGAGIHGSVSMTFNNNFLPATESVNGASVSFGYDDDGLLLGSGALTIGRVVATGLPTTATIGSLSDAYTFNTLSEIASDTLKAGSSTIFSLSYLRDNGGRISSVTENSGSQSVTTSYGYDSAGHLSDVSVAGELVRHYEYDLNGNRVSKTDVNGTVPASVDSQDQLQSYGDASYTYDANGELKTRVDASGTTTFTYDASGILRRVDLPNANVIEYIIDGQNRRVGKKVNGTLVQGWLYADQLRIVAETDGAGNVTKRFVYGLRANVPDYMTWSGSTYRFVTDHLGSPRYLLETSGGTVAQAVTYDEYGLILTDTNASFQPFRFAGGLYDPDTKLVHFGAREYDPQTGRWNSGDPGLFTGGTNLYGYAFGDPINYIDRDGRIPLPVVTALVGGAAGFVGSVAGQLIANHGTDCFSWQDAFISAGVGAVAGAAAPFTATTYLGAMLTGAVANTVQTATIDYAHGRDSTAGGLGGAAATGMLGGIVGGPVSTAGAGFNEATLWGDRDLFRQVNQAESARQAVGGIGRSAGAALTTNTPQDGKCGCQ